MPTIRTRTRVGPDGSLTIRLPIEAADKDIEVVVSFGAESMPVASGWPEGFLESTHGAWQGRLVRPEQGKPDKRISL